MSYIPPQMCSARSTFSSDFWLPGKYTPAFHTRVHLSCNRPCAYYFLGDTKLKVHESGLRFARRLAE